MSTLCGQNKRLRSALSDYPEIIVFGVNKIVC